MHDDAPRRRRELVAARFRVGVAVPREHDLRPHLADRVHLDLGRRLRHHDQRAQPEVTRGKRDALCVVAGAGGDDAARALRGGEVRDAVVGAAKLETENGLKVFALEQDFVAQPARQARRGFERRFVCDVVHAARQDEPKHRLGRRHVRVDRHRAESEWMSLRMPAAVR